MLVTPFAIAVRIYGRQKEDRALLPPHMHRSFEDTALDKDLTVLVKEATIDRLGRGPIDDVTRSGDDPLYYQTMDEIVAQARTIAETYGWPIGKKRD